MTASGSLAWTTPATVLRAFVRDLRSGAPHLRTRGTLVLLALAGYLAFMCGLVVHQAQAVQRTLAEAEAIGRAADALDGLAFDTAASASARARRADANLLAADAALGPSLRRDVAAAVERAERLGEGASDAERAHAAHGLRRVSALLHAEAGQHADSLRLQVRRDAIVLVATGLVGIAILGFAILRFLGRLSAELTAARLRAVDIVDGKVAPPAAPQDEVGQLSAVIDQLAAALAARRNELEIERRKRFHEEKMAAIGSLAAGVLTEIGNPIAAIDGFARAMKDGDAARLDNGSGNGDDPADAILEQTARLLVVARQIEEFTAPRPLQRQLVDVNGVVEAALGFLRYDESMQSIRVELALDRQLPAVTGIPDRLVQLVMNLVGNAADALAGKPRGEARVSIATRRAADAVVLEVADNGTGMREEVRARAFEPFFSTKPHGQGTGLGLPLCNSIVGDHGGLIHVDSAPGRGTSVTIRLPFARGESR